MLNYQEFGQIVCSAVDDANLNALDEVNLRRLSAALTNYTNLKKADANNGDTIDITVTIQDPCYVVDFLIHDKSTDERQHKQFKIEGEVNA